MMNRVSSTPRCCDSTIVALLSSSSLMLRLTCGVILMASAGAFCPCYKHHIPQQQALSLLTQTNPTTSTVIRRRPNSLLVVSVQGTAQDVPSLEETIQEHGRRFMDLFRFHNGSPVHPVVVKQTDNDVTASVTLPSSGMGLIRGMTSTQNNNNAGRREDQLDDTCIGNGEKHKKRNKNGLTIPAPSIPNQHETLPSKTVALSNGVTTTTTTTTASNGASTRLHQNNNSNSPASLPPDLLLPSTKKKRAKRIPRINLNDLNDVRLLKQQRQLELGNRPTSSSSSSSGRWARKRPGTASLLQQAYYDSNVPHPSPSLSSSEQVLQAIKREKAQIKTNYERLLSGAADNSYVRWKHLEHDNHHHHYHHHYNNNNKLLPPLLPTVAAKRHGTIYQQLKRTRLKSELSSPSSSPSSSAAAAAAATTEPSNHHYNNDPTRNTKGRRGWNFSLFRGRKNIPPSSSLHPFNPLAPSVSAETTPVPAQSQSQSPPLQLLHPRLHDDLQLDAFQHEHQQLQLISSHRIRQQQLLHAQQQAHLEVERHALLEQQNAAKSTQEMAERQRRRMAPFQPLLRWILLRKPSSTVDRDYD